jgi:uncharacterized damage-inducible protein DinB
MNPLEYAQTMASYNVWMNTRLYAACAELSDDQRKRDLGAFFKSLHGTLNHLLLADRIWLSRFKRTPYTVASLDQELYADFAQLRAQRQETDDDINAWVNALSVHDFDGRLSYVSIVNPQPRTCPFWFAVVHFFNHQTHHRGQVTTLLKQSGSDPGVTDLLWLPKRG